MRPSVAMMMSTNVELMPLSQYTLSMLRHLIGSSCVAVLVGSAFANLEQALDVYSGTDADQTSQNRNEHHLIFLSGSEYTNTAPITVHSNRCNLDGIPNITDFGHV